MAGYLGSVFYKLQSILNNACKCLNTKNIIMIATLNNMMKKCILVYDDDIEILQVTRLILEEKQYHVESRTRCDDIIRDIEDVKPDVILMDIWIPEIGGETAICLIKHHEVINTIPVIVFSAMIQIETLSKR